MSAFQRVRDSFASQGGRPLKILGASGQLGYGIPSAAFNKGLTHDPDLIGCDMGSIDIGPYYLGSGQMAPTETGYRRDLKKVLLAARRQDIPLVFGSAGSSGAGPHLETTLHIIREISSEEGLHFKLAWIPADISKPDLAGWLNAGRVTSLDGMPPLQADDIETSDNIVGQMGVEAFIRAIEKGADVIVAGRACDTGIFASLPIILGFPPGLSIHMAKIVECASLCCIPGGRDTIMATLEQDHFILESMAERRAATPESVAAHSLYEQSDPYRIIEPGGQVSLEHVEYTAIDARRTRVSGAEWRAAGEYTIKLEGARFVGYRSLLLAGVADPFFLKQSRKIVDEVSAVVDELVSETDNPVPYELSFRIYGVDGVREWPEATGATPNEGFVLGQCLSPDQDRADEVIRTTKQYLLHHGYEGRYSTAGNLAFPFTPPEVQTGKAYEFSIYHLVHDVDPCTLFPIHTETL